MPQPQDAPRYQAQPEWIDSHCHLADPAFADDLDAALERAAMVGVRRMLAIGDTVENSRRTLALCEGRPGLRAAAGVHPHHAAEWDPATAEALEALLDEAREGGRLVALGEIGLDYHYGRDIAPAQRRCFLDQCGLARRLGLPLVIHVREAFEDFLAIADGEGLGELGGVVHCYSGTPEDARRLAQAGLHLGIGGILTFKKNETLCQTLRAVPIEALLVETDAPYLAPTPHRGKRNEPALLVHIIERMVTELGRSEAELAEQLFRNTLACLRLDAWEL